MYCLPPLYQLLCHNITVTGAYQYHSVVKGGPPLLSRFPGEDNLGVGTTTEIGVERGKEGPQQLQGCVVIQRWCDNNAGAAAEFERDESTRFQADGHSDSVNLLGGRIQNLIIVFS